MEMFAVRQIDDANHTPERDRPMRSRQPFHIEDLAVRGLPPMKLFAIPGSNPAILDPNIQLYLPLGTQEQAPRDKHKAKAKELFEKSRLWGPSVCILDLPPSEC